MESRKRAGPLYSKLVDKRVVVDLLENHGDNFRWKCVHLEASRTDWRFSLSRMSLNYAVRVMLAVPNMKAGLLRRMRAELRS